MHEKMKNSQERIERKILEKSELAQNEELQNTQSNEEMDETEIIVKNGTANQWWRDFWRQAQKRRDEKLQNTQSDEEEVNSIAEKIRERLDAKEEINKILTKFKIK